MNADVGGGSQRNSMQTSAVLKAKPSTAKTVILRIFCNSFDVMADGNFLNMGKNE